MQYSERFKAEMVQKMMGPSAMSANRLAQECGVRQPTLSSWLRQAKVAAMARSKSSKERPTRIWTPEEKLRVVLEAAAAGEAGLGELLRREGLHEADLARFQKDLTQPPQEKRSAADKKLIAQLQREVRRKDKALAEAVALAVLSKKLNAYFGEDEVGDTNEESEK